MDTLVSTRNNLNSECFSNWIITLVQMLLMEWERRYIQYYPALPVHSVQLRHTYVCILYKQHGKVVVERCTDCRLIKYYNPYFCSENCFFYFFFFLLILLFCVTSFISTDVHSFVLSFFFSVSFRQSFTKVKTKIPKCVVYCWRMKLCAGMFVSTHCPSKWIIKLYT